MVEEIDFLRHQVGCMYEVVNSEHAHCVQLECSFKKVQCINHLSEQTEMLVAFVPRDIGFDGDTTTKIQRLIAE